MTTLLTAALAVLAFALLSLRPADGDSRSPREMRAALRHAGSRRTLLTAARIALVASLLLLVEACRLSWQAAACIGFVLAALAQGLDALGRSSLASGRTS
jgi:hypothetical protein